MVICKWNCKGRVRLFVIFLVFCAFIIFCFFWYAKAIMAGMSHPNSKAPTIIVIVLTISVLFGYCYQCLNPCLICKHEYEPFVSNEMRHNVVEYYKESFGAPILMPPPVISVKSADRDEVVISIFYYFWEEEEVWDSALSPKNGIEWWYSQ